MRGKRYLIAVDACFVDRPGGGARVAWDFAEVVRDAGGTVGMVCLAMSDDAPTYERFMRDGIHILRIKRAQSPFWDLRRVERAIDGVADAVAATLSAEDWDVVHIHSCITGLGTVKGLGHHPRIVKTIHSPMEEEYRANETRQDPFTILKSRLGTRMLRSLERRELDACRGFHVLSQYTKKEINRIHGSGFDMTFMPHWRRPELARAMSKAEARGKLGWPQEQTILFTVRNHRARTGIDTAIHAIAPLVNDGSCCFYIGGKGHLLPYHQSLVNSLGAEKSIHLMGRISDEELRLAYQAADLFILPTRALECFGLIILESYAYGLPVLGTTAGAIPEIIGPISPELLCPPDAPEAMNQKLRAILGGSLALPSSDELLTYVDDKYGADVIEPQLLSWLSRYAGDERRAAA